MLKLSIAFGIVVFFISGVLNAFMPDKPQNAPSQNISEYTECMNSPNTRFMAGMHQQKYPNVSVRQISHILCKDSK
jgi:hypothetical protein